MELSHGAEAHQLRSLSEHHVNTTLFDMLRQQFQNDLSLVECTKATLVQVSRLLEELVITHHLSALFCSSFPDSLPWRDETTRYAAVAANARATYVFTRAPLPTLPPRVVRIALRDDGAPPLDWFTAIYAPTFAVLLCAYGDYDSDDQADTPYTMIWSFVPEHVQRALDVLDEVIALRQPDQLVAFQQARLSIRPEATDMRLMTIFSAAMIGFEEQLRQTIAQTSRSLDAQLHWRKDLTAMLVHDLRTPLQSIMLALGMLRLGTSANIDMSVIDTALRSADTMNALVQMVLDTSLLEANQLQIRWQPINPAQLIADAVQPLAVLLQSNMLTLSVAVAPATPLVWGDPLVLLRVLQNVVANAVKFSRPQDVITLSALPGPLPATVQFVVRDTGQGIQPTALPHVFERHYQAEDSNRGGAGLGLYFCKLAVGAHNGTIHAVSQPQLGTSIIITVPAQPPA